jgi:DNA-binding response OmpR family regulator
MIERPVHVLLIEDDEGLRSILARHLASRGLRVAETATAEDAIERLASGLRPSVVLLDLNLPGATGWELLRGAALADAGRPAVVVITATGVNPARLRAYDIAGYLPKPFPLQTLVSTVERLLGARV